MTIITALSEVPASPALNVLESTIVDAGNYVLAWSEAGMVVRRLRGRKMLSTSNLMNEVAAALQFPHYFGENWAALNECLSEEDVDPRKPIVVLIEDAAEVLSHEPVIELTAFATAAQSACEIYSAPIALGEWWDRPAVPFHVVLQAERDRVAELMQRWTAAGASLEPLSA